MNPEPPKKFLAFRDSALIRGVVFSVLFHLLAFGAGLLESKYKFLARAQKAFRPEKPTPPQVDPRRDVGRIKIEQAPPELLFVDVDPLNTAPEPPKDAKFYGAANSEAANPKPKIESEMPDLDGSQDKILRLKDAQKNDPKPLQPAPDPASVKEEAEEAPTAPKPSKPATYVPGPLSLAKPDEKPDKEKSPKVQSESETPADRPKETKRTRPRLLEEASKSMLKGEKMKQEGGVNRLSLDSSLGVKATIVGEYDREFVAAVQQRWDTLLEGRSTAVPGKVVLQFRLHQDGRITDVLTIENSAGSMLGLYCEMAIRDPSPYRKWPTAMRRELAADFRDVKFTFYYLTR